MIIFNLKAVLVALGMLVPLILGIYLELNLGLVLILTGIVGFFVTMKLSPREEGYSGMPTVFFIPTHVPTLLIVVIGMVALFQSPSFFDEKRGDLRVNMLEDDEDLLDKEEFSGNIEKATLIKEALMAFLVSEMEPEELHCLVKQHDEEDKVLILVKLDQISKVAKEARPDLIEFLEEIIALDGELLGSELYIGVKGNSSYYLAKAEGKLDNSNFASSDPLLAFYAPKKITE